MWRVPCTILQTHHLLIPKETSQDMVSVSIWRFSRSRKKPITSADTAWQYCVNGYRHMPDRLTSQQRTSLSVCTFLIVIISVCNEPVFCVVIGCVWAIFVLVWKWCWHHTIIKKKIDIRLCFTHLIYDILYILCAGAGICLADILV